jgi:molybdopterin molybdotransferase
MRGSADAQPCSEAVPLTRPSATLSRGERDGCGYYPAMISVEEAQSRVLAAVELLDTETIDLGDALGRVLREDIAATHDIPSADNSAMDGYAVRAADVANAPITLRVIEDLPAGKIARGRVTDGTAMRIMTGALLPDGADSVVQVELTDGGSAEVQIREAVRSGTNVRRRGEDMRAGDVVLRAGTRIGPAEVGVLASAQRRSVSVARRPTIAILATGDELVEAGEPLGAGQVVNSNAWSLAALVAQHGAIPRRLGIVRDDRDATIAALESALACDFVITSGGVSVGAYDFVKNALEALGAETMFWRIAMKPGKPVVLSRLRGRLVFGLPGNPVSSMVSFLLFVAPALRKSLGMTTDLLPPAANVRLLAPLRSKGDRRAYLRVRVGVDEAGELVAQPMTSQGSGVSTSMVGANGLAIVDAGVTSIDAGQFVKTLLIGFNA